MSKNSLLIILGLLITFSSQIHIPGTWKTPFFIVAGVLVIFITYLNHRERKTLYQSLGLRDSNGQASYVESAHLKREDQ